MLGAELLNASAQVIAARTGRMVQGLTDPAGQDLAELSLMTTEKTEALAASAAALSVRAGAVGERLGQAALDEGARAMQAATEIACALTPLRPPRPSSATPWAGGAAPPARPRP
ncbi:hypothetical protein [Brevundimonas aurantiaca]|uniref:hypothetical protein n=1 Tax=Brevundimonas aurantiaca TaxID=74316 RepID=UPI001CD46F58|nr:hypothetical protein [Brevundimonas aurantiaca]